MNYSSLVPLGGGSYADVVSALREELPPLWLAEYEAMCRHVPNVMQFAIEGLEHLFDYTSDPAVAEGASQVDDRLVVVFGLSSAVRRRRDQSRMHGFLGGGLTARDGSPRDKGHFIGHAVGGGTDVNLFPQRPEVNRGRSSDGKRFRRMERFAAKNPNTFVFARPLYTDRSWEPAELEYGLLTPDRRLWVESFRN